MMPSVMLKNITTTTMTLATSAPIFMSHSDRAARNRMAWVWLTML
jgi:hypothetical protein